MRILKGLMVLMVALVVLTLLVVGYFFTSAKVTIAAYTAEGIQASERPELFTKLKNELALDSFQGTLYKAGELSDITNYALITYTLRLSNQCLVPVDMVEVQVVPDPNDVLQLGDLAVHSLEAKTIGDITATILTSKDSHAIRELIVTYYVWGVSFSIRQTYGG